MRAELEEVAQGLEALDAGRDRRELMEYDVEVHRLIYRAAGNRHLEESLVRLDNLATRIWCLVLDRLPAITEHISEHVGLLQPSWTGTRRARRSSRPSTCGTSSGQCARSFRPIL